MHEMLKTAFSDNGMGRTQTFEWFSRFKRGQDWLKIVSIQIVPPQAAQTETWMKSVKLSTKNNEVPFWRSLAS
jgi:hypothetical protein